MRSPRTVVRPSRRRIFFAGIFCLLMTLAAAQESTQLPDEDETLLEVELRRFTVELIIFSYADSLSSGTEIFIPESVDVPAAAVDATESGLAMDQAAQSGFELEEELNDGNVPEFGDLLGDFEDEELTELIASDRIQLRVLMPDELTMTDIHEKLVLLDAYHPVMWAGWTQATFAKEETPFIRLRRLGNIPLAFDGNLKLYLSRFLHLVVDIAMDGESPRPDERYVSQSDARFDQRYEDAFTYPIYKDVPTPAVRYQILEDRIVRSDDIRYFDHPKFGVLAKITRYEEPEEDEFLDEDFDPFAPQAAPSFSR